MGDAHAHEGEVRVFFALREQADQIAAAVREELAGSTQVADAVVQALSEDSDVAEAIEDAVAGALVTALTDKVEVKNAIREIIFDAVKEALDGDSFVEKLAAALVKEKAKAKGVLP